MRIKIDKIASVTSTLPLFKELELSKFIKAREGTLVLVEALDEKDMYGQVELVSGEMVKVCKGDIIAGVLGERRALSGYVGKVPASIAPGDTLHLLNLGGTVGLCTVPHREYGAPIRVRVLGTAKLPFAKNGHSPNIRDFALPWRDYLEHSAPIVLISGTAMNAGKTTAACSLVSYLAKQGYRVAAAKLTGVSLMRDVRKMKAYGALKTLSFTDAGLPSTTNANAVVPAAKAVLHELNQSVSPDVIVAELGDGIQGGYGVEQIFYDVNLMAHTKVHVMCANDPVGAWGAKQLMQQYGLWIDVVSGPATDNLVGIEYINQVLNLSAANAADSHCLGQIVESRLKKCLKSPLLAEVDTLAASYSGCS